MSTDNAADYAKSLAESIWENDALGTPFGVVESIEDATDDLDKGDEYTATDYLSDVLDIQYIVSGDRTYRAARVLIAFGGPNAWINTLTGQLEVAWWSAPVYEELPSAFIERLDEALEELWSMGA